MVCVGDMGGGHGQIRLRTLVGILTLGLVVTLGAACSTKPKDYDMLTWTKPGWDPRQEDRDYAECYEYGKSAAYRKFHWRRQALSREVDQPTGKMSPAAVMSKLQDIALDEKVATTDIAEDCMRSKGYELVTVDKARR